MCAIGLDAGMTLGKCITQHRLAISIAVTILLPIVVGLSDARFQGILKRAAGLRGDAGARADICSVGVSKDAVVERVTHIV